MVATLDPLKAQPHTLGRPSAIQCPIYLFKEHYNSLCDGKDYVNRSDFNPFHIPHILPHIAILETADKVNDTGLFDFKIRLSGEEVVNCHRANHTGKKLSDIYDGEELLDRLELYNSILHQPRIKVLQNITRSEFSKPELWQPTFRQSNKKYLLHEGLPIFQ